MQSGKVNGIFKVKYKTPFKVKTLKEYQQFKEAREAAKLFPRNQQSRLRDTRNEILFIAQNNST